jgi:hypothetical protein
MSKHLIAPMVAAAIYLVGDQVDAQRLAGSGVIDLAVFLQRIPAAIEPALAGPLGTVAEA